MTSLISRLNALVGKTPDEIAARLQDNGWICGKVMTGDQRVALTRTRVRIIRLQTNGTWYDHGPYDFSWDLDYIHRALHKHWFKPEPQYGGEHDRPYPAS